MKKTFITILFTLSGFLNLLALENQSAGSRPLSLSNAFVSISDTWSTFHNQAGIAGFNSVSATVFYESRFGIEELKQTSGSFILPTRSGTFGFCFSQFGKGSFKENKLGIAFAKTLSEKFRAAIQLDYLSQLFPENRNTKGFATFEAGIIYSPTNQLFFGAHVFNPIEGGIETPEGRQKMPVTIRVGGHYQFDESLLLIVETQKDIKNSMLIKTGIEFSPAKNFFLRFGISGKPVNYTSGMGYRFGKIATDIAFSYHGNLGITPSISLQIEI